MSESVAPDIGLNSILRAELDQFERERDDRAEPVRR